MEKLSIFKHFHFKLLDEKSILVQMHKLQVIVNMLRAVKIEIPESF